MANPEIAEIQEYIQRLILATRSGEMKWITANPTTYSWDTPMGAPQRARLTLQRVEVKEGGLAGLVSVGGVLVPKVSHSYVLQAFEFVGTGIMPRITVSGTEYPELKDQMESLFELITSEKKRKELDFLKSIVPKS